MRSVNITCYNEIAEYCRINNISNVDNFINNIVYKAYMIEKYGILKKTSDNKLVNIPLSDLETDKPDINTNKENNLYNE